MVFEGEKGGSEREQAAVRVWGCCVRENRGDEAAPARPVTGKGSGRTERVWGLLVRGKPGLEGVWEFL